MRLKSCCKEEVKVKSLSRVPLLATPWTAAYQAPPPMGFSRQEYWSGVPLPSPVYIPTNHELRFHLFSSFLPIFATCTLFHGSHADRCKVISHGGFDLHFPGN